MRVRRGRTTPAAARAAAKSPCRVDHVNRRGEAPNKVRAKVEQVWLPACHCPVTRGVPRQATGRLAGAGSRLPDLYRSSRKKVVEAPSTMQVLQVEGCAEWGVGCSMSHNRHTPDDTEPSGAARRDCGGTTAGEPWRGTALQWRGRPAQLGRCARAARFAAEVQQVSNPKIVKVECGVKSATVRNVCAGLPCPAVRVRGGTMSVRVQRVPAGRVCRPLFQPGRQAWVSGGAVNAAR